MHLRIVGFLIYFFFVGISNCKAEPKLQLKADNSDYILLNDFLQIFQDNSKQLSIKTIASANFQKNFIHTDDKVTSSHIWLKINIQGDKTKDLEKYLVFKDRLNVNFVEIFVFSNQKLVGRQKAGMYCPLSDLKNAEERFKVLLSIPRESDLSIYIQIYNITGYNPNPSCSLESIPSKLTSEKNTDLVQMLIGGLLLMLLLYNFLQYLIIREISYVWYMVYIGAIIIFLSFHTFVLVRYFLSAYPKMTILINALAESLSEIAYISFIQSFFDTKNKFKRSNFLMNYIIYFIIAKEFVNVYFILADFNVFLSDIILSVPLVPILVFVGFILTKISSKTGQAGQLLLYGMFGLIFTVIIANFLALLIIFGYLAWTFEFLTYFLEIGIVFENICFSLALSQLNKQNQEEKLIATKEIINLQEELNEGLEKKVHTYTKQLQETLLEMDASRKKIHEINNNLTASIRYAKQIQDAILPLPDRLNKLLPNHFIFYKPVNIISGDFYWIENIESKPINIQENDPTDKKNLFKGFTNPCLVVIVGDCTGHGVSGALMSMIAHNLLNNIVLHRGITEPKKILTELNKQVIKVLKQKKGFNKDGMDIAVCVIDSITGQLTFAGANRNLVYIKDNKYFRVDGVRQGIGGFQKPSFESFTNHTLQLKDINDSKSTSAMFYMFTDGYQNQFGEQTRKKFMGQKFQNLLLEISPKVMQKQKEILAETFQEWKGNLEQTDDILVIGFRMLF